MAAKRIFIQATNPYFAHWRECIRGIYEYAMRYCPDWRFVNHPLDFYRSFQKPSTSLKNIDGVLFWITNRNPLAEEAIARGIAAVNLNLPDTPLPFPVVSPDHEAVGRMAGRCFAHPWMTRTIYFGPDNIRSRLRFKAFSATLKEAQRPVPVPMFIPSLRPERSMLKNLERALGAHTAPNERTGIFAFSDSLAYAASETVQRAGWRIPRDVNIVGCDNDELICSLSHPPLSSIPIGSRQIGSIGARLLQNLLQGKPVAKLTLAPPNPLVERMSSSAYPTDDPVLIRALAIIQTFALKGLNVNELVQNLGISRRNLENRFRQQLDCSPLEAIQRFRIEKAIPLLQEGGGTNAAIASQCGFSSAKHLTYSLRKSSGVPPSHFRHP